MMKFGKRSYTVFIIFISLIFTNETYAQEGTCKVTFASDYNATNELGDLKINIFQNNLLVVGKANMPITLLKGIAFSVEFESSNFILPGIVKLKVFQDTVITIVSNSMSPVIINSKKRLVRQTLDGYDYYPSKDSIYKNQSILLALQRLPFVTVIDDKIEYKDQKKILFQINGKERKGIGNNWEAVLKVIKAKDIYKVELIEEIPLLVKNQGFDVIINILTVEANIHGKSINAIMILNQRENLNPSLAITQLRKRADFSIKLNNANDNQIIKRETAVFDSDALISKNIFRSEYVHHFLGAYFNYGVRIDSFKNFSINASYKISSNNTQNINEYNFPDVLNNQKNTILTKTGAINISYVLTNKSLVTRSFIAHLNVQETDLNNRLAYIQNFIKDSVNNVSSTKPYYLIAEYNVYNSKNHRRRFEYGVQTYSKKIEQSYYKYSLDAFTNENKFLLYQKKDSFLLWQYSIRPYFKLAKVITDKKSIVIITNAELYSIKNKYQKAKYFFLPSMSFKLKQLLKRNYAVTYKLELSFLKPSTALLTPIQSEISPSITTFGSANLVPGKSLAFTVDYTGVNKLTISHSAGFVFNFDALNYFTLFDSVKNTLLVFPDNKGKDFALNYSLYFQKQINKKLRLSATARSSYIIVKNTAYSSKYNGFTFGFSHNINYNLGPKYGSMGLTGLLNSNNINSQGTKNGIIKYILYYAKVFFKGKLVTTLSASEFLLKRRRIQTNTKYNNLEHFNTLIQPSRLLSLRVSYNFSTIRISKIAKRKSTSIDNETIL